MKDELEVVQELYEVKEKENKAQKEATPSRQSNIDFNGAAEGRKKPMTNGDLIVNFIGIAIFGFLIFLGIYDVLT